MHAEDAGVLTIKDDVTPLMAIYSKEGVVMRSRNVLALFAPLLVLAGRSTKTSRGIRLNHCVGLVGLSGLLAFSAVSQAAVITWDTTSSPLSQGWEAGNIDSAIVSFQSGVVTVDTSPAATGVAGLIYQVGGFDDYVFEFSIKMNSYSSTNLNGCWLEPLVSSTNNGNVHQFRPQLCSSGVTSEVINNTGNGTGATPFSVAVDPHETDFHIYRYEGSVSQSTYSFYVDGELKRTGGMLVRNSGYVGAYTHYFSLGEGSTTFSANFDLNGLCIATDGDDCSLSTAENGGDGVAGEATPVPALSFSALMLMGSLLGLFGLARLRR